ncbi:ECF transporter S component [Agreia sp. PsM10]|uniref:ECF transporter S component n=1 Tax=Agreia sp. PsM10 TaxID=3030533 RepID=UPI00263A9C4D|nr:ECF transporter S component [Agreia sp. PsM10]MDN4641516.1 ECF transporter S component [Agreia sp. PsM10]
MSTRLLLTCAAIGVAGGLVFALNAWIGGTIAALAPLFYGFTIGVYFVPGVVAQYVIRRGGVAVLTASIAGLVTAPLQPLGFWATIIAIAIGAFQELPFLVTRYRRWSTWLFLVGGVIAGVVCAVGMYRTLAKDSLDAASGAVLMSGYFVAPVVFTALAVLLGAALVRTGVARGLRSEHARSTPAA